MLEVIQSLTSERVDLDMSVTCHRRCRQKLGHIADRCSIFDGVVLCCKDTGIYDWGLTFIKLGEYDR